MRATCSTSLTVGRLRARQLDWWLVARCPEWEDRRGADGTDGPHPLQPRLNRPTSCPRDAAHRRSSTLPDAAEYVAHVEAVSPIRPFTDFWRSYYTYEFRRTNKAACLEDGRDAAGYDWPLAWRQLFMPVALVRCRQPLGGGLMVPDDVAADIASTVPGLTVTDVDADHFTVMTHAPAAEALRALVD